MTTIMVEWVGWYFDQQLWLWEQMGRWAVTQASPQTQIQQRMAIPERRPTPGPRWRSSAAHRYTSVPPSNTPARTQSTLCFSTTSTWHFRSKDQACWNATLGQPLNWTNLWTRTFQSLHTTYHLDTVYKGTIPQELPTFGVPIRTSSLEQVCLHVRGVARS